MLAMKKTKFKTIFKLVSAYLLHYGGESIRCDLVDPCSRQVNYKKKAISDPLLSEGNGKPSRVVIIYTNLVL